MSLLNRNSVLTSWVDSFCLVCESYLRSDDECLLHIAKPIHRKNLDAASFLDKFKEDHVRKVKKGYYCEYCNILMTTAAKVGPHVSDENHGKNKAKKPLKREGNGVLAFNKVFIPENAWHGLIDDTCTVCDAEFEDPEIHKTGNGHVLKLVLIEIEFSDENLYRKVDDSTFQCLTCNMVCAQKTKAMHFDTREHRDLYQLCCNADKAKANEPKETSKEVQDDKPIIESEISKKEDIQKTLGKEEPQKPEVEKPKEKPRKELGTEEPQKPEVEKPKEQPNQELGTVMKQEVKKTILKVQYANKYKTGKTDQDFFEALGAKKYMIKDISGHYWCILCDWAMDEVSFSVHRKSKHHRTMLRLHQKRMEEIQMESDKELEESDSEEENKIKILGAVKEFTKNNILLNCADGLAYCRVCSKNIDFEFDFIKNHIDEHKKKPAKAAKMENVKHVTFGSNINIIYSDSSAGPKNDSESKREKDLSAGPKNDSETKQEKDFNVGSKNDSESKQEKDSSAGPKKDSESNKQEKDSSAGPKNDSESNKQEKDSSAGPKNDSESNKQEKDSSAGPRNDSESKQEKDSSAGPKNGSKSNQEKNASAGPKNDSKSNKKEKDSSAGPKNDSESKKEKDSSAGFKEDSESKQEKDSSAGPKNDSKSNKKEKDSGAGPKNDSEYKKEKDSSAGPKNDSKSKQQKDSSAGPKNDSKSYKKENDSSAGIKNVSETKEEKDSSAGAKNDSELKKEDSSAGPKNDSESKKGKDSSAGPKNDSKSKQEKDSSAGPKNDFESKKEKDSSACIKNFSETKEEKDSSAGPKNDSEPKKENSSADPKNDSEPKKEDSSACPKKDSGTKKEKDSSAGPKNDSESKKEKDFWAGHKSDSGSKKTEKDSSASCSTAFKNDFDREISSPPPKKPKKGKEKASHSSAAIRDGDSAIEIFSKLHDMNYNSISNTAFCRVCVSKIPPTLKSMREHVKGASHKNKVAKVVVPSEAPVEKKPFCEFVSTFSTVENTLVKDVVINEQYCLNIMSFFMLTRYGTRLRCQACEVTLAKTMVEVHKQSPRHERAMDHASVVISVETEFIREIRPNIFHCGFCNVLESSWRNMESHLKSTPHRECKIAAYWRVQEYTPLLMQNRGRVRTEYTVFSRMLSEQLNSNE